MQSRKGRIMLNMRARLGLLAAPVLAAALAGAARWHGTGANAALVVM